MPLIKSIYNNLHFFINKHIDTIPFFPKSYHGKRVLKGHVSGEHLDNPQLDDELVTRLNQSGIKTADFHIDTEGYKNYIKNTVYPLSYYGGGRDPHQNFIEKTLEHYVSLSFLPLGDKAVFMDIAAATSPFSDIVKSQFPLVHTYKQDLIFPRGVHGHQIGGDAAHLPLPDNSIDGATLHCSLEHFEGDSDSLFFQEIQRVLKPGGLLVVLPFYIAHQYTNHVDPAFNLLKRHRVKLDKDPRMQLRYATWKQYFSRHYDPQALHDRVVSKTPELALTVYRVKNFKAVDASCYLRFIGVFTKKIQHI
jgi:SAM-dependent methyltransferase